jgi:hypothetical protein
MKSYISLPINIFTLFFVFSCSNFSSNNKNGNKLIIPNGGFEFKLYQRSKIEIPSDSSNVYCHIGDITRGQTRLTLKFGSNVLIDQYINDGGLLNFQINSKSYQIECINLVNKLIGDDFGFFKVTGNRKSNINVIDETNQIEELLKRIEKSKIIFIRNGTQYSSKKAADHLRSKWEHSKGQIKTLNEFIKKIASKSSYSGKYYLVKLQNGTIISAEKWYELQMKNEHKVK